MDWIKLHTRGWLYGSCRVMSPEKRGIWVDLLALAAETKFRDGSLRFEKDRPMPRDWIANQLMITRDQLDIALGAFQADINIDDGLSRVQIWEDGTIFITNWDKYQGKPDNIVARDKAIEKRKETNRRRESATDRIVDAANLVNASANTLSSMTAKKAQELPLTMGKFNNVELRKEDYYELVNLYGEDKARELIEDLSIYMQSSGKKYENHYATLLNWTRRQEKDKPSSEGKKKTKDYTGAITSHDDLAKLHPEKAKRIEKQRRLK